MSLSLEDQSTLNHLLYEAVQGTDAARVRTLIDKGADVNMHRSGFEPVLHNVLRNFSQTIFATLLDAGADIDMTNRYGLTVLHTAINGWRADQVKYLVSKGANPLFKSPQGDVATPLEKARTLDTSYTSHYIDMRQQMLDAMVASLPDVKNESLGISFNTATERDQPVRKIVLEKPRVPSGDDKPKKGGFTV